jgi:DNA-binding LacI/PurR family transcriptional regulator
MLHTLPHNIVKFDSNTETIIYYEQSKKLGFWNRAVLSNSTCTFLFIFYDNTAGYNTAVAHFIPGHSRNCTFFNITGNQDEEDETRLHLFFAWLTSECFIETVFSWSR